MLNYPISVTIDTNIFDAAKYNFGENSTLNLLSNHVKNGKIKVVLSEIVIREARAHISKQVEAVCGIVKKLKKEVLKESTECLVKYIGLDNVLEIETDKDSMIKKAHELFEKFLINIKAEELKTDLIDLDSIIDDYFEIRPPFEKSEKKRKEFPDAFIANQIRERFADNEFVAIISKDKGFIAACGNKPNFIFFNSLGDLYNRINEDEVTYNQTIDIIQELQYRISAWIAKYIRDNENIDVIGLSYDNDGIESGFDYSDFCLYDISNTSFRIHSVDELTDITSTVTLACKSKISADCFFEDYDNAIWDSEEKKYAFVETINMREIHDARFACRIELNRETKEVTISPFTVVLGGDSRKEVYVVEEQDDIDYEQEIEDMDRETLGFNSLGSYESYMEEDLSESEMCHDIIGKFEELKMLYSEFEDFSIVYDTLLEELDKENSLMLIKELSKELNVFFDFPKVDNEENISKEEIDTIKNWVNYKYEYAYQVYDEYSLPDTLNYGQEIVIKGVDGSERVLAIDEIEISPTEGDSEYINIRFSNNGDEEIKGYVKLTVGYLNFDEDGGASDGMEDEIEYEYFDIIKKLDDYIMLQNQEVQKEQKIIEIIKNVFGEFDIEI